MTPEDEAKIKAKLKSELKEELLNELHVATKPKMDSKAIMDYIRNGPGPDAKHKKTMEAITNPISEHKKKMKIITRQ